jgi:LDH2 family malate/lactate/ureidoglycolate dehydrogenase
LIGRDGKHTTDPTEFNRGDAILLLGGTEGHKGYSLSIIVEKLSGLLTGLGFGIEPSGRHNDGCFMAVFNVKAFRPLEEFKQEVTELALSLKDTPPSKENTEVYYPGELEHIRTKNLLKEGILIEDATWAKINKLANEFGVKDILDIQSYT